MLPTSCGHFMWCQLSMFFISFVFVYQSNLTSRNPFMYVFTHTWPIYISWYRAVYFCYTHVCGPMKAAHNARPQCSFGRNIYFWFRRPLPNQHAIIYIKTSVATLNGGICLGHFVFQFDYHILFKFVCRLKIQLFWNPASARSFFSTLDLISYLLRLQRRFFSLDIFYIKVDFLENIKPALLSQRQLGHAQQIPDRFVVRIQFEGSATERHLPISWACREGQEFLVTNVQILLTFR